MGASIRILVQYSRRAVMLTLAVVSVSVFCEEVLCAWSASLVRQQPALGGSLAMKLTPADGSLWRDEGIRSLDRNPAYARACLERAVHSNSFDSESWIGLGLLAEAARDEPEAERSLLRATKLAKSERTREMLAGFYFRQRLFDDFWVAAVSAADVPEAELDPVFRMANELEHDPDKAATRLQLNTRSARENYLAYLLNSNLEAPSANSIVRAALSIQPPIAPGHSSNPLLLNACERLLSRNRTADALLVWNRIAVHPLNPDRAVSVSSPDLEPGSNAGFDWRPKKPTGINVILAKQNGLSLTFSGSQDNTSTLVEQLVPVVSGKGYSASYRYTAEELESSSGITWRVSNARNDNPIAQSPMLENATNSTGRFEFSVPPDINLVRLSLFCSRSPGSVRTSGFVRIREFQLRFR